MTNGDIIRGKTNEELAKMLADIGNDLQNCVTAQYCITDNGHCTKNSCYECALAWIKQEVTDEKR